MTTLATPGATDKHAALVAKLKEAQASRETTFQRLTRLNAGLDVKVIRRALGKEFVEDRDERDAVLFCMDRDKAVDKGLTA